ncbi:hypothetical protein AUG19_05465 [archaeon 13_1_20CM_2_54_9]|nr:MAG: hypothetical protein AUG19_05465 [archaeon 13_1_20CM_2_54_9]
MTSSKRHSLTRAMTRPWSILLLWQSAGWISFGVLNPIISQRVGDPADPLVPTVAIIMASLTAVLGLFALFYWRTTVQRDIGPKEQRTHKCLSCGHTILLGTAICPYCGSKTFF